MDNIEYKLTKIEGEFREAKIVKYDNVHLQKSSDFPAVMFHVQRPEDLNVIKQYYFQQYPSEQIFGFTVPFHNLASYVPELLREVPQKNTTLMCDIESEIFWHSTDKLKPDIQKFYEGYAPIPAKIKQKINKITSTKKFIDRIENHRKFWADIVHNKNDLMSLLTTYINRQHGYQIGILSGFAPLILDKDHLDFVEECYTQTKRLYHNDATINLENDGKIIGLYANFHSTFLGKSENIVEFGKMVERVEPKALIFKIFNLDDIRSMKLIQKNYDLLIKTISNLSRSLHIPTFYFSTHTAGYKANVKGIDVFCEPFNRKPNSEVKFVMSGDMLRRQYQDDPLFKSGKIYDIKTGNHISRREFQNKRLTEKGIDSPISGVSSSYTPNMIRSMTDRSFRDFAKLLLMESRNYEESQLHKGIKNTDLKQINEKLSIWQGAEIPK